jgi:2,4-diketo-3-deoxy-L-fuconate hydrolase
MKKNIRKCGIILGIILVIFILSMLVLKVIGDSTYSFKPLFDKTMTSETVNNFSVAPTKDALTFARYEDSSGIHVLLVTNYTSDWIEGIDINTALQDDEINILNLFKTNGYNKFADLNKEKTITRVSADKIIIPIDTSNKHIAMGGNYLEHGKEVNIENPWIFPKIVSPTNAFANVPRNTEMLDSEVEMGLVILEDLKKEDGFPEYMGIILVNDFSDRKLLVEKTNIMSKEACTGCTAGKSRENYLPIGNLLIIPRDFQTFYPDIEIQLYINEKLRQKASVSELTLNPSQIIEYIWTNANKLYNYQNEKIPLIDNPNLIKEGTIVLTGTPAGVIFSPPSGKQIMEGIANYGLSFNWWNRSPLDSYFKGAEESGVFLQSGDRIISSGTYLGILNQNIVPE